MNETLLYGEEQKIKIFASDDNLKELGELLSNDSSRKIIYNLMTKEMYTNELATKLEIRVSLVIHHLKKMEDLGMLTITNKKIKRKGLEHRFFKINSNILVVIDQNKAEIEAKGFLNKIFKDGVKFSAMIVATVSTWLSASNTNREKTSAGIVDSYSNNTDTLTKQVPQEISYDPIIISLIVLSCFLLVIWISKKYK